MLKFKISKATLFHASALMVFAMAAMGSSSSKEFNEGFREGYNAVWDACSENTTQEMDTTIVAPGADVAQLDLSAQ